MPTTGFKLGRFAVRRSVRSRSQWLVIGRGGLFLQGNEITPSIILLRRRMRDFRQLIVHPLHTWNIFRSDDRGLVGIVASDGAPQRNDAVVNADIERTRPP